MSDPKSDTTALDRATWTVEEVGMILSARDQFAINRRCEGCLGSLCDTSFTNPCSCLHDAISRVARDLMDAKHDGESNAE